MTKEELTVEDLEPLWQNDPNPGKVWIMGPDTGKNVHPCAICCELTTNHIDMYGPDGVERHIYVCNNHYHKVNHMVDRVIDLGKSIEEISNVMDGCEYDNITKPLSDTAVKRGKGYCPHKGMAYFTCPICGSTEWTSYPQSAPVDRNTTWTWEYHCIKCGMMMGLTIKGDN